MMRKEEIRKLYKLKRRDISESEMLKWSDLILIQFQQLPIETPHRVLSYAAIEAFNEFDPILLVEYLEFKNPALEVCYPVINEDNQSFRAVKTEIDTSFEQHEFGMDEPIDGEIVEPSSIDLIIVPLLAFDESGRRVGYGKGMYDKFFEKCRPDVVKVGVSYFDALDEPIEDANDYDLKMDFCVTPNQIYFF